MSKTKEQIMEDEYKNLIFNWENAYKQSPSIFKAAHSAMDEYAKQQAIAFVVWTTKEEWYYDVDKNEYFHNHFTQLYTPEQMFDLFISQTTSNV